MVHSIKSLQQTAEALAVKLKAVDGSLFQGETYGLENEYVYKGLIAGLKNLNTDIFALTQNHDNFISISTNTERIEINELLIRCSDNLESPDILATNLDELKKALRPLQVRTSKFRAVEFLKEINNLRLESERLIQLTKELSENKRLSEEIFAEVSNYKTKIESKISEIKNSEIEIVKHLESLDEKIIDLDQKYENYTNSVLTLEESKREVDEVTVEIKSNEKVINNYIQKLSDKEAQLESLENKTKLYEKLMLAFEQEHSDKMKTIGETIIKSRQALNYATADGLSAAFQSQYEKELKSKPWLWMVGASINLLGTIALGIIILFYTPSNIPSLIARIAILPFPVIGAIFCANQYTKIINVIHDYAYKAAITKSIVGFSDQLLSSDKTGSLYPDYLKQALNEIYKDPLRKRLDSTIEYPDPLKSLLEITKNKERDQL